MLDQRQRDVLGLALMAAGVFLGFVLYGGWDGGHGGHAVAVALGWVLGRARVLAPVALFAAGGALLLRPVLPAMRPLRTGSICLFAGITLALSAGALGVSSSAATGRAAWTSAHLQSHGGVVGQALYEASDRLVQSVGVDILVVFLLLTGVILLTGASLAGVIRATGGAVADTTRLVRDLAERDGASAPAPRERISPPSRSPASWWFARPTWRPPRATGKSRTTDLSLSTRRRRPTQMTPAPKGARSTSRSPASHTQTPPTSHRRGACAGR